MEALAPRYGALGAVVWRCWAPRRGGAGRHVVEALGATVAEALSATLRAGGQQAARRAVEMRWRSRAGANVLEAQRHRRLPEFEARSDLTSLRETRAA